MIYNMCNAVCAMQFGALGVLCYSSGVDEALFQGAKVNPTKKKKVKRSVNESRVSTQDQPDLNESALSAQCAIVICKRCQR